MLLLIIATFESFSAPTTNGFHIEYVLTIERIEYRALNMFKVHYKVSNFTVNVTQKKVKSTES
jgi:hypothetical protein